MSIIYKISLILVIIGAINWGMIGVFNIDLVELLFKTNTFIINLIYSLVGIAGLISTGILLQPTKNKQI